MKRPKPLPTVARGSSRAQVAPGAVQPAFLGGLVGALAPVAIQGIASLFD